MTSYLSSFHLIFIYFRDHYYIILSQLMQPSSIRYDTKLLCNLNSLDRYERNLLNMLFNLQTVFSIQDVDLLLDELQMIDLERKEVRLTRSMADGHENNNNNIDAHWLRDAQGIVCFSDLEENCLNLSRF